MNRHMKAHKAKQQNTLRWNTDTLQEANHFGLIDQEHHFCVSL